jgi:endonuclease/exonuclease/phosphatase family metal-dependent hydrolase
MLAVDLQRNGRVLAVVNTHLQAQYLQNSYDDVRRAQLVQLAVFLDGAGARHSLIFGGDLNTEAGEALYGTHLAPLGFDLTAETRRNRGGTTCFDRHGGRSEWIDYVFVRGLEGPSRLEKIDSDAPDDPYSDHDGLLLHLSVAGTGSPERLQPT